MARLATGSTEHDNASKPANGQPRISDEAHEGIGPASPEAKSTTAAQPGRDHPPSENVASPSGVSVASTTHDASQPLTATTLGYDSAQKEAYDTETHAHEARHTANNIETEARELERDRDEREQDARES